MLAIADSSRSDEWTQAALGVTEATGDPRTRRWAGSLHNNLGWSRHDQGDHTGALEQFQRALDAYRIDGSPEQVRVARWAVARALRSLGRYDEALAIQQQLIDGPEDGYVSEEFAELLLATGRTRESRPYFARAAQLLASDPWFDEPDRLARLADLGGALPDHG